MEIENVDESPRCKNVVWTEGMCDMCEHWDGHCRGQCCETRRAHYWSILMGYMSSGHHAYAKLGHRPGCTVPTTRHTGDGHIRPCYTHFKEMLPRKLPPVCDWIGYIVDTLPECRECGATLHWSRRQEVYLFSQHLREPLGFKDPVAVAAELRRLGEIDRTSEHAAVRAVDECDRAIALAQQWRELQLQRIAADEALSDDHLREVLSSATVSQIMTMRPQ